MLRVDSFHVGYKKGEEVVKGVTLELNKGEPTVLLGPNGSGKSTLIKAIVGAMKPQSGTLYLDGEELDTPLKRSKAISYVPQQMTPPPLSVYETILTGRMPIFGYRAGKEDKEATLKIMTDLDLMRFANKPATELSGGEAQKVMFARALVSHPKAIIFDEPTSNLDIANQLLIHDEIARISKEDVIVLIAMHDINLALSMGKKFYCMKDGVIIKEGDDSIIDSPLLKDLYGVDAHIAAHDGIKHIHFGGNKQ